jgi:hypothetical protein
MSVDHIYQLFIVCTNETFFWVLKAPVAPELCEDLKRSTVYTLGFIANVL